MIFKALILLPMLCWSIVAISCTDQSSSVYRGQLHYGFEKSSFTPCGSSEEWWVEGEVKDIGEFVDNEPSLLQSGEIHKYGTLYVELRGDISPEGHYGHLHKYKRLFVVSEVVEVRLQSSADCK
jgi:hypothetical protein